MRLLVLACLCLSAIDAKAGHVAKKCIDFFEPVLKSEEGKSAIPVECQYYQVRDLAPSLQSRVQKIYSDNHRMVVLDQKLSVVAGEIMSDRLVSRSERFEKKSWAGKSPGPGDLSEASYKGDQLVVERILEQHGSKISQHQLADSLRWAAYYGHEGVVKVLLKAGANPRHVFKDPGRGSDRGADMDVIQWLEFNRERCPKIHCVDWGPNSSVRVDRALELLRR